jgi:hypothetical protein
MFSNVSYQNLVGLEIKWRMSPVQTCCRLDFSTFLFFHLSKKLYMRNTILIHGLDNALNWRSLVLAIFIIILSSGAKLKASPLVALIKNIQSEPGPLWQTRRSDRSCREYHFFVKQPMSSNTSFMSCAPLFEAYSAGTCTRPVHFESVYVDVYNVEPSDDAFSSPLTLRLYR